MTTDLTAFEIDVREKVYAASQASEPLALDYLQVKALASSILKTGREICVLRSERDGTPLFKLTPSEALAEEFRGRTAS